MLALDALAGWSTGRQVLTVTGTFISLGIAIPFSGGLTVDRFGEVDGQLVVEGDVRR